MSALSKVVEYAARILGRETPSSMDAEFDMRVRRYRKMRGMFDGWDTRGRTPTNQVTENQCTRLRYNFAKPICVIGASWVAAPTTTWQVMTDSEVDESASKRAAEIWDRSGADGQLLSAVLDCNIMGDAVGIVRVSEDGGARIVFEQASCALPTFVPGDRDGRLEQLVIADTRINARGEEQLYLETWTKDSMSFGFKGSQQTISHALGECPARWIANEASCGRKFGVSDIDPVYDAALDYNHIASKHLQIIDYYAAPTIYSIGANLKEPSKNMKTWISLPMGAEVGYLEWKGSPPDIRSRLEDLRQIISEVSEVPQVAFGQIDDGFSGASGISLKVLYAPLSRRTTRKRSVWGPALEALMGMALRAEGLDVADNQVRIVWGSAEPANRLDELNGYILEQQLGVPKQTLQRRMGYTQQEINEMQATAEQEMDAEMDRQIALSIRGPRVGGGGGQGNTGAPSVSNSRQP